MHQRQYEVRAKTFSRIKRLLGHSVSLVSSLISDKFNFSLLCSQLSSSQFHKKLKTYLFTLSFPPQPFFHSDRFNGYYLGYVYFIQCHFHLSFTLISFTAIVFFTVFTYSVNKLVVIFHVQLSF